MAMTMDSRAGGAATGRPRRVAQRPPERDRAFRQARRHTAIVRTLRLAMPAAALIGAAAYGLSLGMSWQLRAGRLDVGSVQVTADDLTMKNPSYFGLTKDGGRYEVRAKQAVLEFSHQAPVKLVEIDGDLVQANNVVTKLKARRGLLDNAKGELELFDGIEIDASSGLKARLTRATVFSKENRVVSKQPVDVTMPTGHIKGAAMTLRTDARQATFVGSVSVRLVSAAPTGQSGQPGAAFGRDARQPVDVQADNLHVDDNAGTAVFMGSVVAVQGDSTMKTPELQVHYEGKAAEQLSVASTTPQPGSDSSRLSRLLANGGAVVTIGSDRRISADQADFDAKADTALFSGNVLVNQGRNVLQGQRLFVDRKTGRSRLEAPAAESVPAGRIAATFYQTEAGPAAQKAKAPPPPDPVQAGAIGTFRNDPTAPIDIEADTLDVHDATKQAIFRGNVKSQQGDFVVRAAELTAVYSGQTGFGLGGSPDPAVAARSQGQLVRVEARQKVLVTSKDGQTASGDWAIFDVKSNTVLMGDRVIVSRGKDVAQGPRLKMDLTSGMYRFELEDQAAASAPASSASPPQTAPTPRPSTDPATRSCPPGKQCLLFYPKEAQDKAQDAIKKALPGSTPEKLRDGWQPSNSASPVLRSD